MHVYGKSFSGKIKLKNYLKFIRARFARIYPLFLFSFLSMIAFYLWYRTGNKLNAYDIYTFNFKSIPNNLFLVQSMGIDKYLSWDTPSWSVSTEWWMYFIFPFIIIPFEKIKAYKNVFVFLLIIAGYLFIIYYLHPLSNSVSPFPDLYNLRSINVTYDYGFLRCFLGFFLGMLIYKLYQVKWLYSYLNKSILLLIFSIALVIILSFKLPEIIPVIFFAAILLMSAYNAGLGKTLLNLKPLLILGDISYSIYLMHFPILLVFITVKKYPSLIPTNFAISWLYLLVYLTIVILVSSATYKFIEIPMREKINNFN